MQRQISWVKLNNNIYALKTSDHHLVQLDTKSNEMYLKDGQWNYASELTFRKSGFWKPAYEVTDSNGKVLMQVQAVWFSTKRTIQTGKRIYTMKIVNNPTASLVVSESGKEIRGYSQQNSEQQPSTDSLLHSICWYYYSRLIQELSAGDDLTPVLEAI